MRLSLLLLLLVGCSEHVIGAEVGTDSRSAECSAVALPTSRNTNYTPATPVLSTDLNEIQDCIIGMKFPKHWRWYGFARGCRETLIAYDTVGGLFSGCIRSTGAARYTAPVIHGLPPGTLIDGFKYSLTGNAGGGTVNGNLKIGDSGALSSLDAANPGNGVTSVFTDDPVDSPYTILDQSDVITLDFVLPTTGYVVNAFALRVSRL